MSISLPSDQAKRSIVVVEDDRMIAELMLEVLQDEGYQVVGPFSTCTEASSYLTQNECGVVVLDHHLSDGSTMPLFRMLTDMGVACVLCSGGAQDQWGDVPPTARQLHKPFRLNELIDTVSAMLP